MIASAGLASDSPGADPSFDRLLDKIRTEHDLDFRSYKLLSLKRRINKRLAVLNLDSYLDYSAVLDADPGEYSRLLDTVLINVSEFFRDPAAWKVVESQVLPALVDGIEGDDPIKMWSAGCSSGEEPYTLGILLAEALGEKLSGYDIKIYATDIDQAALAEARQGLFAPRKLENVSDELLEKYFQREGDCYRISRSIRRLVAFGYHDLITDPPISRLDLLVCRNVQIYFTNELQSRIMGTFNFALKSGGYAFFGKSESIQQGARFMQVVSPQWRIFKK